ncbi:hypothetical protein GOP47_0017999 [Adiantum capillus-veneris]|uniref:Cytochrome P450 n=1 Tax=Adiantum capillus-veneris TaxID=13818 RepID=A0A9D4UHM7_ADICA|nr:hypothetical protein GOP47_0017999 [Adiantum capillus-veneris]
MLTALALLLLPAALACLVAGIVWTRRRGAESSGRQEQWQLPPAPPGRWPVIGHFHLLGPLPHQTLAELAKRHGPNLMSLHLGSVLAIVASTPQAAQLLLQSHDHCFASRHRSAATLHLGFNRSDILTSPPSAYWRRMRQLCSSDLFSPKRILSFQPMRAAGVRSLLSEILAHRDSPMQLRPALLTTMLDIIAKMAIGRSLSRVSCHATDLMSEGYERRLKAVAQQWGSLLQGVLDERRWADEGDRRHSGSSSAMGTDVLDVLLSLPELTDDNIKGVIANMFMGGTDTTAITIEWALAELLANPPTLKALQNELDMVVGTTRLVEEEDLTNLPYLQAVVKETMRLHPVGPFLVPHQSSQACEVGEYKIPADTRVLVNVWAIGRDPNVWDNPSRFDPNRFMEKGSYSHVNVYGRHFELIPFGSGKRKCPALSLGLLSVHFFVASLVQAFDWKLPSTSPIVDFEEKYGLAVTLASPLCIIPSPRVDKFSVDRCCLN